MPVDNKPPTWILRDAEKAHAQAPVTFRIPPLERRRNLTVGTRVKLMFEWPGTERSGERMWVTVFARDGESYIGVLENDPIQGGPPFATARIHFEPRHVSAELIQRDDPSHPLNTPSATAPERRWKELFVAAQRDTRALIRGAQRSCEQHHALTDSLVCQHVAAGSARASHRPTHWALDEAVAWCDGCDDHLMLAEKGRPAARGNPLEEIGPTWVCRHCLAL